jgi:hypothetical protein
VSLCVSLCVCVRVRGSVYVCSWMHLFEGLLGKMCEAGVGWEGVGQGSRRVGSNHHRCLPAPAGDLCLRLAFIYALYWKALTHHRITHSQRTTVHSKSHLLILDTVFTPTPLTLGTTNVSFTLYFSYRVTKCSTVSRLHPLPSQHPLCVFVSVCVFVCCVCECKFECVCVRSLLVCV